MSSIRASAVPVCAPPLLAAAALAGCAGEPHLPSQLPSGVSLAGDWKLDPAHSDDLGNAVQELRAQQAKARHEAPPAQQQQGLGGYGRHRGTGGGQQEGQQGEGGQDELSSGPEGGELGVGTGGPPRTSAVDELMSNVPQGDYLRIKVS